MRSYDDPQVEVVDLGTGSGAITIPAKSAVFKALSILDASAIVGATPAAATVDIGDGTTQEKYGTITVASGGTDGDSAVITLSLTAAAYEIGKSDSPETVVFTPDTVPVASVVDLKVVIGRF